MVTTVRPKASATPTRPMPVAPSEAARTAAPVPPKTSQNVPKNSVAAGLPVLMFDPHVSLNCDSADDGTHPRGPPNHKTPRWSLAARHPGARPAAENKKGARTGAPEDLVAGAGFEPATFGLKGIQGHAADSY